MEKIANFRPFTKYYFQQLELAIDQKPEHFDEFIFSDLDGGFANKSRELIMEKLLGTLVRCTQKECSWLAKNPILLPHWFDAFTLLCKIAGQTSSQNATDLLLFCGQCFLNVIKVICVEFVKSIDN